MAALVVVDVDPEVAVARLVEHRGMREADVRARMARQVSREERLGQGRPRDRQLRHARGPGDRGSTSSGRSCSPSGPRLVTDALVARRRVNPDGTPARRTEVDALPLFSVLWALAAVWHLLGQPAHRVGAGAAPARRRRRCRPVAAGPGRAAGRCSRWAASSRCGPRRRCSATTGSSPALVDLALLLRGGRRGGAASLERRHRPGRPVPPGRSAVPARLLLLRVVRQAQLGVLRPVGELRHLLLPTSPPTPSGCRRSSSTARPGSSGP